MEKNQVFKKLKLKPLILIQRILQERHTIIIIIKINIAQKYTVPEIKTKEKLDRTQTFNKHTNTRK